MNRAARQNLLDCMEATSRPIFKLTVQQRQTPFDDAVADVIRKLGIDASWCVLPPSAQIEFIKPRNLPRVVAGKGRRRRGVTLDHPRLIMIRPVHA